MDDRQDKQLIQASVDRRLAGVGNDPWLAQRVLAEARKPKISARRKLTVGMAVALVLMLATVGAVAITLLSGKDFVAQVAAPMAQRRNDNQWTAAEVDRLLILAEMNGVEITEGIRPAVSEPDGLYKEELLRQFMKADFGFSPAAWPLEEQAWYDEMCVRCGLQSERTRFLPEGNEISQETALDGAIRYIQARWHADVGREHQYRRYIQYMLTEDGGRRWDIEFEASDGSMYIVCMASDGTVDELDSRFHAPEPPATTAKPVPGLKELTERLRDDGFYTVENLAAYAETYGSVIQQLNNDRSEIALVMRLLAEIPYALPQPGNIAPDEALVTARQLAMQAGWTSEQLSWCRYSISYRQYNGEAPYYRICFKLTGSHRADFYRGTMPFGVVIRLDPATGDCLGITTLQELDDFDSFCEFSDSHDSFRHPGLG